MCTPLRMPLASSVRRMASVICSGVMPMSRSSARAPSYRRFRCASRNSSAPSCSRIPSHTPSPSTKPESNTDTTARSRCTRSPLTYTCTSALRGSSSYSWVPVAGAAGCCSVIGRSLVGGEGARPAPARVAVRDAPRRARGRSSDSGAPGGRRASERRAQGGEKRRHSPARQQVVDVPRPVGLRPASRQTRPPTRPVDQSLERLMHAGASPCRAQPVASRPASA